MAIKLSGFEYEMFELLKKSQKRLDQLILHIPTGPEREKITEENILILNFIDKVEKP